ncbi:hypothetical protein BJX61DRAFT_417410 [Aspergillus egyptiacus]|nr:hypothetical protein BJX61DRAFT_417410 [Aspergillus egyptiacus]
MANLADQLAAQLLQTKSLPVSSAWLHNFLSTLHRNDPLPTLIHTALFRLLASDFRQSLTTQNPSSKLPVDIFDPNVQQRRLPGTIPVQVLDIEDIGSSLWSQVEAIERVERGEAVRGREIVRTVNVGDEEPEGGNGSRTADADEGSSGPHRLILQDAAGTRAVGIEMKKVHGIGINKMAIGAKMLLRNVTVARGMILLTPESVTLLGGKIESMDQAWRVGRKARLMEKLAAMG